MIKNSIGYPERVEAHRYWYVVYNEDHNAGPFDRRELAVEARNIMCQAEVVIDGKKYMNLNKFNSDRELEIIGQLDTMLLNCDSIESWVVNSSDFELKED
jgi:hypothetical protein